MHDVVPAAETRTAPARVRERLPAIDRLRGLVIVLMALDHVRDYFMSQAISPTDLTTTTPALFATRWITHYCAPIFIFLAGTSAWLMSKRMPGPALRQFLWTRGLWLVVLEFTVVLFMWSFNFEYKLGIVMQVIWATGISMIMLAPLTLLPVQAVAGFAVVMIAGHNLLDPIAPDHFSGAWVTVWKVLHVEGETPLGVVVYPLVPWIGVMAGGYAFGALYAQPALRVRACWTLGIALTLGFLVLRALNGYGDPRPWSSQPEPLFTVLSFLNVTKYPPSLSYVCMTLGPGLLVLRALELGSGWFLNALQTFGRVPLFAYVVHLGILHLLAGLTALAMGFGTTVLTELFLFFPKGWGVGLGSVYVAWLVVLAVLYPLSRWFAALKQRRTELWLSYL
jgi:uncharacterized membrane protein